jgi:teichuronic acid biosynthesis glycosyltransferase TuaC
MRPLIERAAQKGLLKFLGPLPRAKALRILAGSDVAILPSREEGISTVLLEAMALRIPIVATLVNPDPSEINEAVTKLLANRSLAKKLAENAYQRLLSNYEWRIVMEKYLRLYEQLVNADS